MGGLAIPNINFDPRTLANIRRGGALSARDFAPNVPGAGTAFDPTTMTSTPSIPPAAAPATSVPRIAALAPPDTATPVDDGSPAFEPVYTGMAAMELTGERDFDSMILGERDQQSSRQFQQFINEQKAAGNPQYQDYIYGLPGGKPGVMQVGINAEGTKGPNYQEIPYSTPGEYINAYNIKLNTPGPPESWRNQKSGFGLGQILSIAAAIAIPVAAPALAGALATSTGIAALGGTAGAALTGAALGAGKAAIFDEDIGKGALLGGVSGGVAGAFGGAGAGTEAAGAGGAAGAGAAGAGGATVGGVGAAGAGASQFAGIPEIVVTASRPAFGAANLVAPAVGGLGAIGALGGTAPVAPAAPSEPLTMAELTGATSPPAGTVNIESSLSSLPPPTIPTSGPLTATDVFGAAPASTGGMNVGLVDTLTQQAATNLVNAAATGTPVTTLAPGAINLGAGLTPDVAAALPAPSVPIPEIIPEVSPFETAGAAASAPIEEMVVTAQRPPSLGAGLVMPVVAGGAIGSGAAMLAGGGGGGAAGTETAGTEGAGGAPIEEIVVTGQRPAGLDTGLVAPVVAGGALGGGAAVLAGGGGGAGGTEGAEGAEGAGTGETAAGGAAGAAGGAAAGSGIGEYLGNVGEGLVSGVAEAFSAENIADLILRGAGALAIDALSGGGDGGASALAGLSAEEQALVLEMRDELARVREQDANLFNQRLQQAYALIGDVDYFDPEYFGLQSARRAQLQAARAKQAGLRGLTGEERAAEARRYDLETGRSTGTAYDVGYGTGLGARAQARQAGIEAMPSFYPSVLSELGTLQNIYRGGSARAALAAEARRDKTAGLFGNIFGTRKEEDTNSQTAGA